MLENKDWDLFVNKDWDLENAHEHILKLRNMFGPQIVQKMRQWPRWQLAHSPVWNS